MRVIRDSKGNWVIQTSHGKVDPTYKNSVIKYLGSFSPLFEKAQQTCEFDFVLTLLRVRGTEPPGWDPFETTKQAYRRVYQYLKKTRDFETIIHISLWLYGHIVEASEPYEILVNLLNICEGQCFRNINFPDKIRGKYRIPQSPTDKIGKIENKASKINMADAVLPLRDMFDRDLRNAIFHADYSLYGGEVRIRKPNRRSYSHDEIMTLVNKGLAYYEVLVNIFDYCIKAYKKPKIVQVPKYFASQPNETAMTVVREDHGLIGIRDNWSEKELKRGCVPWRLGRFHNYEIELLDANPFLTILPSDRIKKTNMILKFFPKFLRKYLVKKLINRF